MKYLWSLLMLSLLAWCLSGKSMSAPKIIVAINCGSMAESVESYDKVFKYVPDAAYVSGESVAVDYHSDDSAKEADLKYTFDKGVYMYERHSYKEMTYNLPVRTGKHVLILKFAEMYFKEADERVFNIKIANTMLFEDFDIVQRAGSKYAVYDEFIEFEVDNGDLIVQGNKIKGGAKDKKIKVSFSKGRKDNPIVQGIVVYHDSIQNSPREDYLNLRNKWNTQKEMQRAMKDQAHLKELVQNQKKKEKPVIRNDQLVIEKEVQAKPQVQPGQKYGLLRSLLMGPVGILLWSAMFVAAFLFLYRKVFLFEASHPE